MDYLWTPWRYAYVTGAEKASGCIFCDLPKQGDDAKARIAYRGQSCYVVLNTYPYTGGHLMVVPYKQAPDFRGLTDEELTDLLKLTRRCQDALTQVMKPDGFNIGINLGKAAGAGVRGHLHIHVVPRWAGDTNFMPVLAGTSVLPEALRDLAAKLRTALAR